MFLQKVRIQTKLLFSVQNFECYNCQTVLRILTKKFVKDIKTKIQKNFIENLRIETN